MKVSLGYFSCIIIILFRIVSGEYYIKNHVPSYMYKHFDNLTEEIFPSDIRINISLTHVEGTLLYSIDKNRNQLIMTLYYTDTYIPEIKITFRNQDHFITLPTLCGCKICLYEILKLQIKINSKLVIQCNDKESHYFVYNNNKDVDKGYPQPHFKNDTTKEAHLYIANWKVKENDYFNRYQLKGCIFYVLYKDKEIEFTSLHRGVGKPCKKTCIGEICHGGQCYETYNDTPLCDCAKTFLNGKYCNDAAVSINIRSSYRLWKDLLKVSWKSNSKDLLSINNSNLNIRLRTDSSKLILQFTQINNVILSSNYVQNEEHILLLNFVENTLEFYNNKYWLKKTIPTNLTLEYGKYTLTLQSCEGYIDLFGKNITDVVWEKMYIKDGTTNINNKDGTCSTNEENNKELQKKDNLIILRVFIAITVFLLFVLIGMGGCLRKEIMNHFKENSNNNNQVTAGGEQTGVPVASSQLPSISDNALEENEESQRFIDETNV